MKIIRNKQLKRWEVIDASGLLIGYTESRYDFNVVAGAIHEINLRVS